MLDKSLAPKAGAAYVVLRFVIGVLFAFHGVQKLFGVYADHSTEVFSQLWFGGVLELACGGLIALGIQTRWAAFIASGMMAVAYFQFHWPFWGEEIPNAWPGVNGGEPAVVYCFLFLFIACAGNKVGAAAKKD